MTATEAVKMQLERILAMPSAEMFAEGQKDAEGALKIFKGLLEDDNFRLFALAHANLIKLEPSRVALSLVYIGYMAAKLENTSDTQGEVN